MVSSDRPPRPADFDAFLALCAALGRDIRRAQGTGGSASVKHDGVMWVKAADLPLGQALDRDIMVPMRLDPLLKAVRDLHPKADAATDFVLPAFDPDGLRPPVEAAMHAVLPHRVVIHLHCVDTIALAVLKRRDEIIAQRMARLPGVSYAAIAYRRPGLPLASEIAERVTGDTTVLVLFNNGIVICGDSVEAVGTLAARVEDAVALPPMPSPEPDLAFLADLSRDTAFRPAEDPAIHAAALIPTALRFAQAGSFHPDQVTFLGRHPILYREGECLQTLLQDYPRRGEAIPRIVLVPDKGVLLWSELGADGVAMARRLAEVARRIPEGEDVVPLSQTEEHQLLNWEAERSRRALDRRLATASR